MSSVTVTSSQQDTRDAVRPTASENVSATCGRQSSRLNRACQRLVLRRLSSLQKGRICMDDRCERYVLGENAEDDLKATISVNNPTVLPTTGDRQRSGTGGSLSGRGLGLRRPDESVSHLRRNMDWHQRSEKLWNWQRELRLVSDTGWLATRVPEAAGILGTLRSGE